MTPRRASAAGREPFEIGDTNGVAGSLMAASVKLHNVSCMPPNISVAVMIVPTIPLRSVMCVPSPSPSLLSDRPMLDLDPAHGKVTRIARGEHGIYGERRSRDQTVRL